jgi:predicted dehydrogenase
MAILEFKNGAWGMLHTTTCSVPDLGTRVEFNGTQGLLVWEDRTVEVKQPEGQAEIVLDNIPVDPDLPDSIIADMVGAVRDGKPLQCTGPEGRKSVAIFEAIYKSSESGAPVRIE